MAYVGKILIMPKGAYAKTTVYEILDMVSHNGKTWVAKKDVIGIEPSKSNSAFWFEMVGHALANDLSITEEGYALDARQGKVLMDALSETSAEVAVQRARIDQFTKLEDGSTTGDAELMDARVGADGKTYTNLGEAVRTQLTDVKSDLSELCDMVDTLEVKGSFENGSLDGDGVPYTSGYNYRIRNTTHVGGYKKGDIISVKEGYRFYLFYYPFGALSTTSAKATSGGWITDNYEITDTINSYPLVKIVIAKITEGNTGDANIEEFKDAVFIDLRTTIVSTIKSNSTRIETLENAIETIENPLLPNYWLTYLSSKCDSIKENAEAIGNHGDYFAFFTDYHTPQNKGYTPHILEYIKENSIINKFVYGGDTLTTQSKEESLNLLKKFRNDFKSVGLLNLFGNHDFNPYADSSEMLSNYEYYPYLFKDAESNSAIHMEKNGYYYMDNNTQKIRYIFLNTNYCVTQFISDTKQAEWFINTLSTLEDGWGVVVLSHMFFGSVNADYTLTMDGIGTRIKEICDGFANKIRGTSNGIDASTIVNYDFTNAKGNMIAVICGHTHNDYTLQSEAGYPIIACMCDAYHGSSQNPLFPRTTGTYNEQAIDLFFIDTENKTIKTVRVGAGNSREWTFN